MSRVPFVPWCVALLVSLGSEPSDAAEPPKKPQIYSTGPADHVIDV